MIRRYLRAILAPIDASLMTMTVVLIGFAFIVLASAAPDRLSAQAVNMVAALFVMRIAAQMPPQRLMHAALPLYLFGMLLLVAVALFGDVSKGARRWLNIGFTRIQPSEIMKIAMPLMLAWYFQKREIAIRFHDYAVAALLLLLPVGLIAKQPDLGTAILVLSAGFYVIFFAGLPWKFIVGIGVAGLAAIPMVWPLLHDYQRARVLTLFDPESDPLGKGFHIIQSTIAIGSGGVFGKGWGQGTQTQLEFIPERHTDFIFAVVSEEWGLLGNLALLERAGKIFRERCIEGITANAVRCNELLEHSHAQVTALVPVLGYELAADIAREAQQSKESIRNVVLARGLIAPQVLDRLLSADAMTVLGYPPNTKLKD